MKIYGTEVKGPLIIDKESTLSAWTSADEGRLVYAEDTDKVYYGSNTAWNVWAKDVSDAVYGTSWDGVTDVAPSKNAVYDELQTVLRGDEANVSKQLGLGPAISILCDKKNTIEIATNSSLGGVYDDHTGVRLFTEMTAGWTTAQLMMQISTQWKEYGPAKKVLTADDVSGCNIIINGNFSVNQRVFASGGTLAEGIYGHDRWKAGSGGCNYTFAISNGKVTITIPSSKTLLQIVEGTFLQSGTYTLSWEGTAQGKIGAGSFAASPITASVTGGSNLTITFNAGTVANVQLENGSTATEFEYRPFAEELALCQRYYQRFNCSAGFTRVGNGIIVGSTGAIIIELMCAMRAVPSFASYGNWLARNGTMSGQMAIDTVASDNQRLGINFTISGSDGAATQVLAFDDTTAYYYADAEL